MFLRNYKIGARLLAGFAVLGLLVVLQGSMALMNMAQMRTVSDEIEGNTIPTLDNLAALNLDMMRVRIFTFSFDVSRDGAAKNGLSGGFGQSQG